jgi:hypothetical protein
MGKEEKAMPKPNHYYPNYGGLRFGQANNKMIKVKKQNPPMHKSFENILNVLPSNNELHHSFSIINNMTHEKIR